VGEGEGVGEGSMSRAMASPGFEALKVYVTIDHAVLVEVQLVESQLKSSFVVEHAAGVQ
jgi:hypothetical protein